ncbi:MAG: outer membrane beta-barrel protein [Pseudolabrys sp.]
MRKISSFIAAAGFAVGLSQAASAADLPRKAPPAPPPPPPLTWTGCYIGANVGGAWGRVELETAGGEFSRSGAGFAGGGQIGCDYQFAGSGWVIGFRNMFDGTTNSRERDFIVTTVNGTATGNAEFHNRWFDALTGRIGYSWQPNSLVYFQGGAVWSRIEADAFVTTAAGTFAGSASTTKTGWTIGGGWEYRFSPQWSLFIEGNYYDFGGKDGTLFTPPIGGFFAGPPPISVCQSGCAFHTKTTAATALIGVNYRFGGFGTGL